MARDCTCLILCQMDRAGTDTQFWTLMTTCPSFLLCQAVPWATWAPENLDKQVPLNRLSEPKMNLACIHSAPLAPWVNVA